MYIYLVGLEVVILPRIFVYVPVWCMRAVKALARLHKRAVSPEPSLLEYAISPRISQARPFH